MKVSFMKLIVSLFCAVLLMTSCLGSGDSSYQADGVFAYVHTVDGVKYASTNIGNITMQSGMSGLQEGQCYFISFKIPNADGSGVYVAEYINVLNDGYPIDKESMAMGKPYYDKDEFQQADSLHINNLQIDEYYPVAALYGDCWMFKYTVPTMKEDDNIKAYFYYDPSNQFDENRKPISISENKVIIDVRLLKVKGQGAGTDRTKDFRSVGDFKNLRTLITSSSPKYDSSGKYASVAVKFRYMTPPTQGTTQPVVKYIPTNGESGWNGEGGSAYIFFIEKN